MRPNPSLLKGLSLLSVSLTLLLSGCQVVSVKQQALNITIANERNSILMQDALSEASLNVLSMSGREANVCTNDPDACITELKTISQIGEEQFLSAASEIYLAKSMQLERSSDCKTPSSTAKSNTKLNLSNQENNCLDRQMNMLDKSIRYSYAYLFLTQRKPQDRIFDNRQVQIRDFYNQAIAKQVTLYALRNPQKQVQTQIQLGDNTYRINFDDFPQLAKQPLEKFISSYNLNFSGLRTINRRDGFGSEFVAVFPPSNRKESSKYIVDPLHYNFKSGQNPNIHDARYLAVTLVVEPQIKPKNVDQILNNPQFVIKVYDPYNTENIKVAGKSYPLAANFSAPYGLWLAENNLGILAYLSLLDRDQRLSMPHLYKLEPYNPNKKIIVLVHGLASSPEAWIGLTNDIMGDRVLREHYQVWQIFYSTNMPILESRYQIYALLQQAFDGLDPQDAADHNAVLIGHSMGGIISRLLVSKADLSDKAFKMLNTNQRQRFKRDQNVLNRFKIQPIENFDRAIFMSAPHRGTDYADRWFTLAARKIIRLPSSFLGALTDTLTNDATDQAKDLTNGINGGLIQNGPSDLSHKSKFIALTKDVVPPKSYVFHSIMGNITKSQEPDQITDGIVPYSSAHLDGAVSEKIIKGGHSIQETPEALLELRRILRLHLQQHQIK
ncbi:alpha/beta hydrolase [Acinetobacter sp. ACZLY 512]|uniref:esterase/lipase family protein n=1 Tax=Acinetobacter sp. ACZLY 512 TaxID=2911206 RepID=UPI0020272ED4|nr:alpha/beta fold hydrolase [Acinetobacter sp. ACZLY 512]MCL9675769.1 alpha/beta hydrolase [Acinetobacter sp. ACZLY 512]